MRDYRLSENYESKRKIDYAIKKYGFSNFDTVILEDNIDMDDLREKEIYYISKYDTYNNGYNSTIGGDSGGYELSKEAKQSMSVGSKKFWDNVSDEYMETHKLNSSKSAKSQWGNYTKEQYDSHCKKISESHKGRIEPQWKRDNHSVKMSGSGNSNAKKINIYNDKGDIMFECIGNFKKVCDSNNLPFSALRKSYVDSTPIYQTSRSIISAKKKGLDIYKDWYAVELTT
jgi:group I intron endonuclease